MDVLPPRSLDFAQEQRGGRFLCLKCSHISQALDIYLLYIYLLCSHNLCRLPVRQGDKTHTRDCCGSPSKSKRSGSRYAIKTICRRWPPLQQRSPSSKDRPSAPSTSSMKWRGRWRSIRRLDQPVTVGLRFGKSLPGSSIRDHGFITRSVGHSLTHSLTDPIRRSKSISSSVG
jgi:hypothetical protein